MNSYKIAIVGLGPRGLSIIERIVANINDYDIGLLEINIFEPNILGAGCHDPEQPKHLLVNTIASQITVFSDHTVKNSGNILEGPSFFDWLKENKTENISENGYYSRSDFGLYLNWSYTYLNSIAPDNLKINHHKSIVEDIVKVSESKWKIIDSNNSNLIVDYFFLTTGHTNSKQKSDIFPYNSEKITLISNPYPIKEKLSNIENNACVAIEGLGLTTFDILSEFTIGRGGRFIEVNGNIEYIASGKEPKLIAFSRSGLPLSSRAINQKGIDGQYKAKFLTVENINKIKEKGKVDFEKDILPLLILDMKNAYYKSLFNKEKYINLSKDIIDSIELSNYDDNLIELYIRKEDMFHWEKIENPIPLNSLSNEIDFNKWLLSYLDNDIKSALCGNISDPLKSACDVIRDLRDNLRTTIDFATLNEISHRWLLKKFIPIMNRLAVGPPKERIEQLKALIESKILIMNFGPAPVYKQCNNRIQIQSSIFENKNEFIDYIIQARVSIHSPKDDSSTLINNLLKSGYITPFYNDNYHPSGISITDEFNLISSTGTVINNAWALGVLTEGAKFYTFVVPRPNVNSTAISDAGKAVLCMFRDIKKKINNEESY